MLPLASMNCSSICGVSFGPSPISVSDFNSGRADITHPLTEKGESKGGHKLFHQARTTPVSRSSEIHMLFGILYLQSMAISKCF